ncbi:MAG: hypothetical protein P8M05_10495 [Flavobacteriales bacterium]|nr:hypothetical protein [Flavobacteriales bacterium]
MKKLVVILVLIPWLCNAQKIGSQLLGKWSMTEYGTDMTGYQDSIAFVNDTSVFNLELIIRNNELELNRSKSRFKFKDSLTLKWIIRQTDDMARDSSLSIEGTSLILFKKKEKNAEFFFNITKVNSKELVLMESIYNSTYGNYSQCYYKFIREDYNDDQTASKLYGEWKAPYHEMENIQEYDTLRLLRSFDCPDVCNILGLNFIHNEYEPDVFFFSQSNRSKYDGVYMVGAEANWIFNPVEKTIMLIYSHGNTRTYKILSIDENDLIITTANNK